MTIRLILATMFAIGPFAFGADANPPQGSFSGPGAPPFTRLDGKSGANQPEDADGNFLIGPDYVQAPEFRLHHGYIFGDHTFAVTIVCDGLQ